MPGLIDQIDHAAAARPEFGGVTIGFHFELLHAIHRGKGREALDGIGQWGGSGDSIYHQGRAPGPSAVDADVRRCCICRRTLPLTPGARNTSPQELRSFKGRLVMLLIVDHLSDGGTGGVEQLRPPGDFDGFCSGADLQGQIHLGGLIHLQLDSGVFRFLESGGFHQNPIRAGRQ